jgi:hypothetical protein
MYIIYSIMLYFLCTWDSQSDLGLQGHPGGNDSNESRANSLGICRGRGVFLCYTSHATMLRLGDRPVSSRLVSSHGNANPRHATEKIWKFVYDISNIGDFGDCVINELLTLRY